MAKQKKAPATEEQKAEWAEARKAKVAALKDRSDEAVAALAEPKAWAAMLHGMGCFGRRYSLRNVLLIITQLPGATNVNGFWTWKAQGRDVRKGQHGAAILAAMRGTKSTEGEAQEQAKPAAEQATPAEGAQGERKGVRGFKPETVFDISQTAPTNPDAPDLCPPVVDADRAAIVHWPAIVARIATHGYDVETWTEGDDEEDGDQGDGYEIDTDSRTVRLTTNGDLADARQAVHALACLELGQLDTGEGYEAAVVDSVAHIVMSGLKLTADAPDPEDFDAIGEALSDTDPETIIEAVETVAQAARDILDAIDPMPEPAARPTRKS
ncbi:hypothetical protein Lfu02_15080 [Longispora fulva]|uniref:N-terminal domain-containing protein n=1 Tax=Longispora fulva TaxID=619741 RepID=A0A8J7GNM9_9ACTN|nr:ArdC family protein [Longispora fulva]MBG6140482.1 hypothetical protein [Longispora fulva]GIG57136.1 hypothetical protein Lfu02_15080 [Longispora fulva]